MSYSFSKDYKEDPYRIYIKIYGKVYSGGVLNDKDYEGRVITKGVRNYDLPKQLAVSLAVQDVKETKEMRTQKDFDEEIEHLIEN